MKAALLSNINADFILRIISKEIDCIPSAGYGDVWGQLLNPVSSLNKQNPELILFLIDIEQLTDGFVTFNDAKKSIDEWYAIFDSIVQPEKDYFISDVIFRHKVISDNDSLLESRVIEYWTKKLENIISIHINVHVMNICNAIVDTGKRVVFSDKLWYMGKIPYSNEGSKIIAGEIIKTIKLLPSVSKKVLVLDLDNTLWGGVLGELGVEGIKLSDDHIGAIYKRVQQEIQLIKMTGAVLAIASKNNDSDVQEVWDKHPHMLLKREDFVSVKINWEDKAESITQMGKELNVGLDSFVFIDDMASERENVRLRLPMVSVPDFPQKVEEYPEFVHTVYEQYFNKMRVSNEDMTKTQQYAENAQRAEAANGISYETFLQSLDLEIERVDLDDQKLNRIAQMHGKTNQFNLTTIRYTRQDINRLLDSGYRIFGYNVKDKFGDYGLVAAAIVDIDNWEINSLLMSCRVMGKLVENCIIDNIENELEASGCEVLKAKYIKTSRNAPVEHLFDNLGYTVVMKNEDETHYEIYLKDRPNRKYYVKEK